MEGIHLRLDNLNYDILLDMIDLLNSIIVFICAKLLII